jgi:hypothetical protein
MSQQIPWQFENRKHAYRLGCGAIVYADEDYRGHKELHCPEHGMTKVEVLR